MALDRKNIDFLVQNTVPSFASWNIVGGASVVADTATLPPNSSIAYELNANYNDALSSADYRRLTLTLYEKPDLASNYKSIQQLSVDIHMLYAVNTSGETSEEDVLITMNEDDIIENVDGTYTVQRVFPTNRRALQACIVTICNTGINSVTIRDCRLQRSVDISTGQIQSFLSNLYEEKEPTGFKIYEPNSDNIIGGLGVIISSGLELKYKPIREGNRLVEIQTNFRPAMPIVYVAEAIDLSTNTDGSTEE